MTVTVDTSLFTADGYYPTADGYVPANLVEVFEPVGRIITADTSVYTADATWPTADVVSVTGAQDFTDAEVVAEVLPGEPGGGFGYYPLRRRRPIFADVVDGVSAIDFVDGEVIGAINVLDGEGDAAAVVTAAIIDVSVHEPIAAVDRIAAAAIIEIGLDERVAAVDQADAVTIEDDAGMILTFLLAA